MRRGFLNSQLLLLLLTVQECILTSYCNKVELNLNRELSLSPEFHLKWNNLDSKWITMEMSCPGRGYVAVGFSGNGGMKGSDIVMGWVDSQGQPHLKDLHGVGNIMPVEDKENNYELLGGEERDGRTLIQFRRKWETCDSQDFALTDDTVRLIWAFGEQDPITNQNDTFLAKYHLGERGGQSTYLKTDADDFPKENEKGEILDPQIKAWDFFHTNNTIVGDRTVYQCHLFKLPESDQKHQLIGFKPIIKNKETGKYIHHMVFFECVVPATDGVASEIFDEYLNQQTQNCYPRLRPLWQKYCDNLLWAIGKDGDWIPPPSGIPVGAKHNGISYLSFHIHYDNPMGHTFVDNSGVRVYYTDQLREFDGGTILVGHRISFFQILPPQMESFKTTGFCSSECTAKGIPEDGVTFSHALLHGHKTARHLTLRHIRNGLELPPLAEDKFYDVNYEQSRRLKPQRHFLPGDELIMECQYDSMDRHNITFAGSSLDDEMCLGIIYYYPKSKLLDCQTQPEFHSFLSSIGIEEVEGPGLELMGVPFKPTAEQVYNPVDDVLMTQSSQDFDCNPFDKIRIIKPYTLLNQTMGDYIRSYEWTHKKSLDPDSTLANLAEQVWTTGPHYMYCGSPGKFRIPVQNYISMPPKISKKYEETASIECQH